MSSWESHLLLSLYHSLEGSVGVVQDNPSYPGVINTARTLAHELGHNLGLGHDNEEGSGCTCATNDCIMMPETGGRYFYF